MLDGEDDHVAFSGDLDALRVNVGRDVLKNESRFAWLYLGPGGGSELCLLAKYGNVTDFGDNVFLRLGESQQRKKQKQGGNAELSFHGMVFLVVINTFSGGNPVFNKDADFS